MSPFVVHRRPDFWENPLEFSPSRFAPEREAPNRFAYIPFGGGPRLCIGSNFATVEATLILAMVTQRFWLDLIPGAHIEMDALVTLRPNGGMPMRIGRY
jgi:cytochrome P450